MVEFQTELHTLKKGGKVVIEIMGSDGTFLGAIYPMENGVKIISKYLVNASEYIWIDLKQPPALNVKFEKDEDKALDAALKLRKSVVSIVSTK